MPGVTPSLVCPDYPTLVASMPGYVVVTPGNWCDDFLRERRGEEMVEEETIRITLGESANVACCVVHICVQSLSSYVHIHILHRTTLLWPTIVPTSVSRTSW